MAGVSKAKTAIRSKEVREQLRKSSDEAVHRYRSHKWARTEIVVAGSKSQRRLVRSEDRLSGDRVLRPTRWCVMVRSGASVRLQGFRTRKEALKRQIKRDRGRQLPVLMAGYYEAEGD